MTAEPTTAGPPLDGVRAIVLTQAWAGALCTELLALMGAEVIQIEVRRRPDSWRGAYDGPMSPALSGVESAQQPWNCSPNFNAVNLNKQSITLDLQTPEGIGIFRRLVPLTDVMAENFSPRVMGNLGIGYEALREIRPDIIYCSLSAYGHTGPYANVPGIGGTIEPTSGQSELLGYDGGPPLNSGAMFPDAVAGMYGFGAIVTALHHRNRTGEGQFIDLSMQEANLTLVGDAMLEYTTNRTLRPRRGNRHAQYAPHGIYAAAGEQQWIALAAEDDAQWRTLCAIAGSPEWLADARFVDAPSRKTHEDALDAFVGKWTAQQNRDALADRLAAAGVPAAPVLDGHEVMADPVLRGRGVIVDVDHRQAGRWPQLGVPFRLSRTPGSVRGPAPLQGEHSAAVLEQLLGISHDEYDELVRAGVTGSGPPD